MNIRAVPAVLILSVLSGCSYHDYVMIDSRPPEHAVDTLSVGDDVRIVTKDGDEITTTVLAIEDGAVVGENDRVPVDNVASVSRRQKVDQTGDVARVIFTYAVVGYLISLAF